jgi:hypothetical protein
MRLSFGAESPDRIEEGMRRLAAAARAVPLAELTGKADYESLGLGSAIDERSAAPSNRNALAKDWISNGRSN